MTHCKINAIYLCCQATPWLNVAKELRNELNIEPKYYVYWDNEKDKVNETHFPGCYFHSLNEAWRGLGFPENIKPTSLDEEMLQALSLHYIIALKMMDRLDPTGNNFPAELRIQFFTDLIGYWLTIIESQNIKLVISPSIPHRVFDYALYVACKAKDICILMLQMTPFESNCILLTDINQMPPLPTVTPHTLSIAISKKINSVQSSYINAIPSYMVNHERKAEENSSLIKKILGISKTFFRNILYSRTVKPNSYWVKKGYPPNNCNLTWIDFYKIKISNYLQIRLVKNFYNSIVSTPPSDGTKFILVALHYQPEETSCPTGGSFSDQTMIIRYLDEMLPKDITIAIKEHRSQFYNHLEAAAGRKVNFYKRVLNISNRICFVSADSDPFVLIDQALATVTISGTIGWESAIRGTPTILFGRAWYEQMPRVYKVKTKKDFEHYWPSILSNKNTDLAKEIAEFHSQIEASFICAKHYDSYKENSDIDYIDSASNLSRGISNFINNHSLTKQK